MKIRKLPALFLALIVAACAGDVEEVTEATAMPAMSPDEMALMEIRDHWATHYNMGHASVVAGNYVEDAWTLDADQSILMDRAAIVVTDSGRSLMVLAPLR